MMEHAKPKEINQYLIYLIYLTEVLFQNPQTA